MLPLQADADSAALSAEIFGATVDRLASLKAGDHIRLKVIPRKRIESSHAETPERAQALFGATHVLHGSIARRGDRISVHVWLDGHGQSDGHEELGRTLLTGRSALRADSPGEHSYGRAATAFTGESGSRE